MPDGNNHRDVDHRAKHERVLPITIRQFHKIMPHAPPRYLDALNAAMTRFQINTRKRIAAFLSQLAVASDELRDATNVWLHEHQSDQSARGDKASHPKPGGKNSDSKKFSAGSPEKQAERQRAAAWDNYQAVKKEYTPRSSGNGAYPFDPATNLLASAYYFAILKGLCLPADDVDPKELLSICNVNANLTMASTGSYQGQDDRLQYFHRALEALAP